jgi:hypothetical protein
LSRTVERRSICCTLLAAQPDIATTAIATTAQRSTDHSFCNLLRLNFKAKSPANQEAVPIWTALSHHTLMYASLILRTTHALAAYSVPFCFIA